MSKIEDTINLTKRLELWSNYIDLNFIAINDDLTINYNKDLFLNCGCEKFPFKFKIINGNFELRPSWHFTSLEGFKTSFEGITIDYKYLCDKNPHALENKRILEKYCDSKSNALSLIDYNNGCEQELIFDEKGMILNKWIYKKDDYKYCFPYITSGKAMSVYEIIQRVAE